MKEPNYENYSEYMKYVDAILVKFMGLKHDDMADFCSMECYEDKIHPINAAINCLEQQDDCGDFIADIVDKLERIATIKRL